MRPKKTRWIQCLPGERCFRPLSVPPGELRGVILTPDEIEALRLACLEGMKQEEAAKLMKISRPTFSRMISSACRKLTDAVVNIKSIKVESGCCKFVKEKKK
jgi:predicted DNA-binding protein (UPF0251 family)